MKDWIPFITKLVWPTILAVLLVMFRPQVSEFYNVVVERVRSGGSLEVGGFFRLGEAARNTEIRQLSGDELSIAGIGGSGGATRKESRSALEELRQELTDSPSKSINALLVPNNIRLYSVSLLKEYISTLGLRFVVFQENGRYAGWMLAGPFVAQLPPDMETVDYETFVDFTGRRSDALRPDDSAKVALRTMQELHLDSMPVVDQQGRWLFFANRGEILAQLMTLVLVADGS